MSTQPPFISIVVPNYNGGKTIGQTLQSLIDQHYPNLEILVVDGASTDDSVEVIKGYEKHIAWWVSEKDSGQSQAINKGFAHASGEIVNWLCSDDVLLPGALRGVASAFMENPTADIVAGPCYFSYPDPRYNRLQIPTNLSPDLLPCANQIPQPGCFFRRSLLDRTPVLDESLQYAMDFELWNYFRARGARWHFVREVICDVRFSNTNKTTLGGIRITREIEDIYKRYVRERIPLTYWHRLLRYPLERVRRRHRGGVFGFLIYYPYQCAIIMLLSPFYGFRRVRWMNWTDFG
jgi:glycosyltransferase involved in cell wall biosynthesis